MIKLSICIATYNRGIFLKETLDSLFSQLTDECEIIVFDSNSTDNTQEIVKTFNQKNKLIKYINGETKNGIDIDYDRCVSYASGKYCWLLSDDDIINYGALEKIFNYINEQDLSLIILNSELRSLNLKKLYLKKSVVISNDIIYLSSLQSQTLFFEKFADYLSFIGCVIIDRELWNKRNKSKYYGTDFIHVGVIFQELLPNNIVVISDPLISIRLNNAQWTQRSLKIWIINWHNLIWSFENFNNNSKSKVIPEESLSQYRRLLYFRAIGLFNSELHKEVTVLTNPSFVVYLLSFIISILNIKLSNLFYRIYAKILNKPWMLIELKKYS
jgi:glycosyltransferase involved in cell wall biosynthesis